MGKKAVAAPVLVTDLYLLRRQFAWLLSKALALYIFPYPGQVLASYPRFHWKLYAPKKVSLKVDPSLT